MYKIMFAEDSGTADAVHWIPLHAACPLDECVAAALQLKKQRPELRFKVVREELVLRYQQRRRPVKPLHPDEYPFWM